MNRRNWLKTFSLGALFVAPISILHAKFNPSRRIKFPATSLDLVSNTVDFIRSPFRGQVILLADGCYVNGPKIDCKEFTSDTEIVLTSEKWVVPRNMTIKSMLIADRYGNILCEQVIDRTVAACDELTFSYTIHLPTLNFTKPCNCDKSILEQPVDNKLTPTPLD